MFGANDRETIDKLANALTGYRTRDSSRGAVPEKPDGYKPEWSNEALKPYVASLESDEFGKKFLNGTVFGSAHKHGIGDKQLSGFLNDVLGEMVAGEMVEPVVDPKKERAALIPDAARSLPEAEQNAAVDKRLNDNLAWIEAMKAQGMPKEAADFFVAELGDRAHGVIGMEWLRNKIGGGAQPHAGGDQAAADKRAAVKARHADPRNNPMDAKFDQAFLDETVRLTKELS